MKHQLPSTLVFALLATVATSAHAYMGPGAGLGMLGSVLAVVGAVLVAVVGIVLLPLRMLLKKRRKSRAEQG